MIARRLVLIRFWPVEGPISAATYALAPGQPPARDDEAVPLSIVAAIAIVALAVISMVRRPRRLAP